MDEIKILKDLKKEVQNLKENAGIVDVLDLLNTKIDILCKNSMVINGTGNKIHWG